LVLHLMQVDVGEVCPCSPDMHSRIEHGQSPRSAALFPVAK